MKNIIQILGPTGVGKSKIALKLAKKIGGEIISADSMQVYKDFNIGTAKLNKKEMKIVPHHLIDILSDCSQFNAALFLEKSFEISEGIIKRGNIPIVCGGTALYLKVMIKGIFPELKQRKISREYLENLGKSKGMPYLWNQLNEVDSEYAKKISIQDRVRIIRALEIFYNQGLPPSEIFKKTETPFRDYVFVRIGLTMDRDKLYKRINQRVDNMIKSGLIDEVKKLRKKYPRDCPPFASLGYKEISMFLNKSFDLDTAVNLIKQHSRNLAKRQLSWFRQEKDIIWFDPDNFLQIEVFLDNELKKI